MLLTCCSEHDVPDVGLVFKTKNKKHLNRKWCIVQFYFWRRWKRICVADCDGQNRQTVKENSVTHKGSAQNYVNTTCLFSSKDWLITHRYWTNAYYLNSVYLTCLITCQSNCLHWQLTCEWTTRMMLSKSYESFYNHKRSGKPVNWTVRLPIDKKNTTCISFISCLSMKLIYCAPFIYLFLSIDWRLLEWLCMIPSFKEIIIISVGAAHQFSCYHKPAFLWLAAPPKKV